MSGTTIDRLQLVAPEGLDDSLELILQVTDPEVLTELTSRRHGRERHDFALAALRLGVLALRQARGQIDADTLRREGTGLLNQVQLALTAHQNDLKSSLSSTLKEYFDPQNGRFHERVDRLLKKDGELESLLARKLTGDDSELHRALTRHVGEESSIFKLLSPSESEGILKSMKDVVCEELDHQRERVLSEFSLDNKESALHRLVTELTDNNGNLKDDLKNKIDSVVKEFSLDDNDSALSRLVRQVDLAQKAISSEFSLDNETSALSRMTTTVESTNLAISRHLTLDDEGSSLYRLKRELLDVLTQHQKQSREFQLEVSEQLTRMQTRREESARSTRHGDEFEAQCLEFLTEETKKCGDLLSATGRETGLMRGSKVGDAVIELNGDNVAGGAKIVIEAKEEKGYDAKKALDEIENARKNRGAEIGVFVFSKRVAPSHLESFERHRNDILVVWDADDAATDVCLRAALSVAKALCVRKALEKEKVTFDTEPITKAILEIEKQVQLFEEVDKAVGTIKSGSERIENRMRIARETLNRQVFTLQQQLETIRERLTRE
ncbi:MAG: hypothetical protein SGJ19_02460 [Planctomycetia bacterium]|nr:hypothetical protein [Planctomycetia bacterium]